MKRWKKVLIIIFSIIIILLLGAYGTYKLYVEPEIVDPALMKLQEVLNDEDVQQAVDDFVNEMLESGYLEEADIPEYLEYRSELNLEQTPGGEAQKSAQSAISDTNTAVSSSDLNTSSDSVPASGSVQPAPTQTSSPAKTSSPQAKGKKKMTLIERAKAEMTAEEFAFSMHIYGKVDVGYVTSNIGTNREAVKAYAKRTLSSSEISRSLAIYSKYSYILKQ